MITISRLPTCSDPSGLLGGDGFSCLVEHPPGVLVCLQLGEGCHVGRKDSREGIGRDEEGERYGEYDDDGDDDDDGDKDGDDEDDGDDDGDDDDDEDGDDEWIISSTYLATFPQSEGRIQPLEPT